MNASPTRCAGRWPRDMTSWSSASRWAAARRASTGSAWRRSISWRSNSPRLIWTRCARCGACSIPRAGATRTRCFRARSAARISHRANRSPHRTMPLMLLQPRNPTELTEALALANTNREKITGVQLNALNRVLEHTAEDMTVTVEAGITLSALQAALGRHRQWLAVDPPNPERVTIADIINQNLSGPRRFGFGTIRDHLIGITVAMADGSLVHSGGKVVKNVAGYDLMKLFVG